MPIYMFIFKTVHVDFLYDCFLFIICLSVKIKCYSIWIVLFLFLIQYWVLGFYFWLKIDAANRSEKDVISSTIFIPLSLPCK